MIKSIYRYKSTVHGWTFDIDQLMEIECEANSRDDELLSLGQVENAVFALVKLGYIRTQEIKE